MIAALAVIVVTMTSKVEVEGVPLSRAPEIVIRIEGQDLAIDVDVMGQVVSGHAVPAAEAVSVTLKRAGRAQTILGRQCEETAFLISGRPSGDTRMITKGRVWIDRKGAGAADYRAFQKRAVALKLSAPPNPVFGVPGGDFEAFVALLSHIDGIPCRIEAETALEGKSEVVELVRLPMTVTSVLTSLEAPGAKH